MNKWYICETGKQCCTEQCILFVDAPTDVPFTFRHCPESGRAQFRPMTTQEIVKLLNYEMDRFSS